MVFSKERITFAIGMLMLIIGVMPSLYIDSLRNVAVNKQWNIQMRYFWAGILPYQMNESIMDPITCPSILVAGDTIQVWAEVNIPEDLLSEYRIGMRGGSLSDTPDESIVIEEVTDWRESNQAGEGKSRFLWHVTISQPGFYSYDVYARNKLDEQNSEYKAPDWDNSDREECIFPVIRRIGITGQQLTTINRLWIAIFLIAGLSIWVWWFNTYPSSRRNLVILLLLIPGFVLNLFIGPAISSEISYFLVMVIPLLLMLLLVFLMPPKDQKKY